MPLHGKIVVIKRNGGDGTEFPLTASCLFGRMPDCDIRIQLPQVSKEHCRIDLNENKEVILTNLSSVNPTCVNGEILKQSERLKHGDVITVIDRSFRFEYPPAPTPKKRSSVGGKTEKLKVLQNQQVCDAAIVETGEKRISTDPHLKDGANSDNIQRSLEKTLELESKNDDSLLQSKTNSPFNDLYQMIKKSLDVKTPWKSSSSQLQTPSSRFGSPQVGSARKNDLKPVTFTEDKGTPKKGYPSVFAEVEGKSSGTPESVKKQRKSIRIPSTEMVALRAEEACEPQKRISGTPQKFTVCEVIEHISAQSPKSPMRKRSTEVTPAKSAMSEEQKEQAMSAPKTEQRRRTSPRNSGKAEKVKEMSKKRKSGELGTDLPTQQMKKKRVSFGGQLSPELFDKRLPPDSPLRKGAAPRRSLSLCRRKQSLLRRASVIGLITELEHESPKTKSPAKKRTPSPKKSSAKTASPKTPTSGKKVPKSASPSPKAASPAKKSPKSKTSTPGPVAYKETPLGKRKSSLGVSGPASLESAPSVGVTPATTPLRSGVQTPTVQGRFSVSRINTPSPAVEVDAVPEQLPSHTVTPKIPIRRKSMKSATRKTQSISKSAVKVMCRRSGISRASMKVMNSWAEIVKFGQTKVQAVAPPAKKQVIQKTMKKAAPKTQTPARKLKGYMSTGHADSPVTIVVGRAHKQTVTHLTGAAPRVVLNTALNKKNMKMDEDLTGIPEMFKTPVNERKKRSLITQSSATKTPAGAQGPSVIEPSVLNTPEETGEMIVSPLSVASTVKDRRYNSEAVQRLLNEDQESSFISDIPALENHSESNEQQSTDLKTISVTTPKQKPEQQECLTGVKRTMKTPRQKSEPVEDLRGKILKTPKQKTEQQECLTGVKRIMKTPRQKVEPLEDIRGKLLKTPKQKPKPQECLTGVKRMFQTPRQEAESLEDLQGELQKTPKAVEADAVEELLVTPAHMQESEDLSEITDMKTTDTKISPIVCLTDIKRMTPKEKNAPVEDVVGVKRMTRTPKVKGVPVEQNFGLKRLMKSPRLRGNPPVDDFEGLQELMEEPLTVPTGQLETNKQDESQMDAGADVEKETSEVVTDDHLEVPSEQDNSVSLQAIETNSPEVQQEAETAADKVIEMETAAVDPTHEKKSVRGRRGKAVACKAAQDKEETPEPSQDTVLPVPVRGRRGKKNEATAPPAVRQTKGRNAKTTESVDVEITVEESHAQPSKVAPKLKRGRNVKKATVDQAEMAQEDATETEMAVKLENDQIPPVDVDQEANDSAAPQEKPVSKPKRGRTPKQTTPEEQDVPQADVAKADEVCSDQLEVLPSETDVHMSPDAMETVIQAPEPESSSVVATVEKKSVRGQRAKRVQSKEAEDKQEAAEYSEEPVIPAPVRGRRGKKVEAAAQPAVKQTRTRNAKSQESTSDTPAVETQPMTEISPETDSVPPAEEAVIKPLRGRKTKQTPVEPAQPEAEENDAVSDEHLVESSQPQQPTSGKPRRGRKMNPVPVEQNEAAEDVEETKKQSRAPIRARRGRNAKQEEEKLDETTESQQPVKKSRRTRKPEQDHVEPIEEVSTTDVVVPEMVETLAEPVMSEEATTVALKPRRGRKAKQDTESVTPVESTTEVQDIPTQASSTDKPKRGRRGKQVAEMPESEVETEEKQNAESVAPTIKPSKARGVKTETSQATPAKRARRGTALPVEETSTESTVPVSEPASAPAEPAKRGRRAAPKPKTDEAMVSSAETNPSEELSTAVVEDTKMSKRSVKWKLDLDVIDIPKVTPVKAVRGRKSKVGDQAGAESKNVSKDAHKPEEEDLSDEVAEAQPVKRARRGAKADKTASTGKVVLHKDAEAEMQPKTRRGRSAKK